MDMNLSNKPSLLSSPLYPAFLHGAIRCALSSLAPVFISGEKGTRKRTLARTIHREGLLQGLPFITINAGKFDEEVTSLLRDGRPLKGTLHIASADTLQPAAQSALYDYLDSGELSCGGITRIAELRIISTSELNPAMLASEWLLEQTLLQRLNIIELDLPALRDRMAEIPAMAEYVRDQLCRNYRLEKKEIPSEALRDLTHRDWPGNIDELEGVVGKVLVGVPDNVAIPGYITISPQNRQENAVSPASGVSSPVKSEGLPISACGAPEHAPQPVLPESGPDPCPAPSLALRLAHDIKNPLVSIKTYANLLEDRFDDREFRQEFYQVMKKDVEKIDRVVEEILSEEVGSRHDTLDDRAVEEVEERSTADLNTITEQLLGELREDLARRKIAVFKYLSDDVSGVPVENGQFRTALGGILLSILSNTADGGDIYISTARRITTDSRSGTQNLVEIAIEGSPMEEGLGKLQDDVAWQKRAMKSQGAEVSLQESESGGISATIAVQMQAAA